MKGGEKGIFHLALPRPERELVEERLGEPVDAGSFAALKRDLENYFAGKRIEFDYPLDFGNYTQFEQDVWRVTRSIPYGSVRSYKWVAERVGSSFAARAVGLALKKNPVPIIVPCHRVVRSDGKIGGFRGGVELKLQLLRLEGAME